MDSRQVTIGGQQRTVEKFSGRKVAVSLRVLRQLARSYREIDEALADYRRDYAARRPVRLTRGQVAMNVAELRAAVGAARSDPDTAEDVRESAARSLAETADAYQSLLDGALKDEEYVERPGIPSPDEMFFAMAPLVMENAEQEVVMLLGLALMTNHEVGDARRKGNLEERMQEIGDEALDVGDADEVLATISAAAEMLLGDLTSRRERLGKIFALFRPAATEESPEPTPPSPTLTNGKPTGSTDSPVPTDGSPSTASTASPTPSGVG